MVASLAWPARVPACHDPVSYTHLKIGAPGCGCGFTRGIHRGRGRGTAALGRFAAGARFRHGAGRRAGNRRGRRGRAVLVIVSARTSGQHAKGQRECEHSFENLHVHSSWSRKGQLPAFILAHFCRSGDSFTAKPSPHFNILSGAGHFICLSVKFQRKDNFSGKNLP